jgi:serine/threonine-protein kinase
MKPEEWNQIDELLQETLNKAPGDRAAFLDQICEGKEDIRLEVESLLAHHDQAQSFLEQPPAEVAAELLSSRKSGLLKGQFIHHYRVVEFLGAGGMGEVYLARDARLHRPVAIKVLAGHFTSDRDKVRRFEQEARAASVLNHPNIVTIHETGQVDGAHFIVAEYIEGQTLSQRLARGPMSVGEALDVALQVANALDAAHASGIVHRDIKPDNVMLRPDGLVKVLDFGLAKLFEPATLASDHQGSHKRLETNPGVVMGTARYMSPEQASGQDVDERTDIWSLGVVLFEMLAGKPPFDGETPSHAIVEILDEPVPLLSAHVNGIPAELERIVDKSLRKKAGKRYRTAREFADDLKTLRAHPFFSAPVDRRLRDVSNRWKRGAMAVAIALALVAGIFPFLGKSRKPIDSLAVVPFVNSGDATTEYLADGISESLVNTLSQIQRLKVAPLSMTDQYKAADLDPPAIGRELQVRAVLTGKLVARGDDVDIQVDLSDAASMSELWKGTYSLRLTNLLDVEKEIADAVASKLGQQVGAAKSDTNSNEAYRLYLQGRYYWQKTGDEANRKMGQYFQQAITTDPNYALAYAGLADYYASMSSSGVMSGAEAWSKSEDAAVKSLALDESAHGHHSLAAVRMWHDRKWRNAETELKRAIELMPDFAEAYALYARLLDAMGRFDEAIVATTQSQKVDPHRPHRRGLPAGMIYFHARMYELAAEEFRNAIEKDHGNPVLHLSLGEVYVQQKQFKQALTEARKASALVQDAKNNGRLGGLFAAAGDAQEAKKILIESEKVASKRSGNVAHSIAYIYAGLGNKDQAIAWLTKAVDQFASNVIDLNVDPRFDTLRGDPRFTALMGRMNFSQ